MATLAQKRAANGTPKDKSKTGSGKTRTGKRGFGLALFRANRGAAPSSAGPGDGALFEDDAGNDAGAVTYSLGRKLRAWWDGIDPADLDAGNGASSSDGARTRVSRRSAPAAHPATAPKTARPPWTPLRLHAAELVWGKGNLAPGDEDYLLDLVSILRLTSDMTVLNLGSGLGGAARLYSERFGLWITAHEASPVLAEAAMERSVMAGLSKKVPVTAFDPAAPGLPAKKYDFVFSREALCRYQDKRAVLNSVAAAMKPTGQFVFTDLVVKGAAGRRLIEAWTAADPEPLHLWSLDQYTGYFSNDRLETLHAPLDLTDTYCDLIISGWWSAQRTMRAMKRSGDYDPALLDALADEAELWALRTAALQSGELGLYRFYGEKKG